MKLNTKDAKSKLSFLKEGRDGDDTSDEDEMDEEDETDGEGKSAELSALVGKLEDVVSELKSHCK